MPFQDRPLGEAGIANGKADAARVDHAPCINLAIHSQVSMPAERQPPSAIKQRIGRFFIRAVRPQGDRFIVTRYGVEADHATEALNIQPQLAAEDFR